MRDMLTTKQVCELLGVDPRTLRKYESGDGRWCTLFGTRFRVYRMGNEPSAQRRYFREEILRMVDRLQRPSW